MRICLLPHGRRKIVRNPLCTFYLRLSLPAESPPDGVCTNLLLQGVEMRSGVTPYARVCVHDRGRR
jgi:hypothetical protein